MIRTVLATIVLLCAASFGGAFTCSSFSPRVNHAGVAPQTMSMSSDTRTRRDFVERAGLSVAGILGYTILPSTAHAATKSKPEDYATLTRYCPRIVVPEVFTTAGGVKFIVLKEGTGPLARDGDYLVVEFTGFLPDGQVFDASNSPGRKPIAFKLGARQVIKGWEEVLRYMNAGAEVQMVVPANLAFGDKGICIDDGECLVKPGMDVRYDLQLKRVAVSP